MMAPRWVYDLAEIDLIDAMMGTVGTLGAYAVGGVPGIVAWAGFTATVTVLRKTPIIPWTVRTIAEWRANPKVIEGKFRDVVIPAWRDDAGEMLVHPRYRGRAPVSSAPVSSAPVSSAPVSGVPVADAPVAKRPASPVVQASTGFSVRTWVQQYRGLEKLPPLQGRHIILYGPTNAGKSGAIKWIFRQRQDAVLIIGDPHYQPGNWPGRAYVLGKGRNFGEIAAGVRQVVAELDRRAHHLAEGGTPDWKPILLFVDEISSAAKVTPEILNDLQMLAREGRKYGIFVLANAHGPNLSTLGFKSGEGDQRANFAFIKLPDVPQAVQHLPRIVEVWRGGAPRDETSTYLGRFVVPAPVRYTGRPHFGLPAWLGQGVPGLSLAGVPDRLGDSVPGAGDASMIRCSRSKHSTPEKLILTGVSTFMKIVKIFRQ